MSQSPQHKAPEGLRDIINSGSTAQALDEHVDTSDTIGALTEIQKAIDATLDMVELIDTISVKLASPTEAASVSLIFSIPELLQQSAGSCQASSSQQVCRTARPPSKPGRRAHWPRPMTLDLADPRPMTDVLPQISERHDASAEDSSSPD